MNSLPDPLELLRTLDPAPGWVDPSGPRARADLARILATEPGTPAQTRKPRPGLARLAAAAAAVLVLGAGGVLLPSLAGGDRAYATWTAEPTSLNPDESMAAAAACRASQLEGAGSTHRQDLESAATAVAERRGAWTLVLLAGDDGFSAVCITDESRPLFRSNLGYVGVRADAAATTRAVRADALGVGSIDGLELSVATGPVGPDVTGVAYTSPERGEVAATVSDGHFAFWLPGNELEDAPRSGIPVKVTYRDGTTEHQTLELR